MLNKPYFKVIISITLIAGILLCVWYTMAHHESGELAMSEHITLWQRVLLSLPSLILLSVVLSVISVLGKFSQILFLTQKKLKHGPGYYLERVKIFDYLLQAFSKGLLNPKTF